jgi:spore germination protein KC
MLLIFMAGCWNRVELNELAIVSGMGFDLSENGYLVSLQVVDSKVIAEEGPGSASPIITYKASGETVFKAVRKMTKELPRKAYFPHLRIVVISEKLAEEGFLDVLDFLYRDHELRSDFYIVIAREERAINILERLTPLEEIPANKLFDSLELSEQRWGATGSVQLDEVISTLFNEGKHPVLTGLILKDETQIEKSQHNAASTAKMASLLYSGMAVFRNDKLIGWLNEEESRGYNYTQGTVQSTIINVPCSEGGELGIEVNHTNTNKKVRKVNGRPKIELEIQVEGDIGDVECEIDLLQTQEIDKIEQKAKQIIKKEVEQTLHKVQNQYNVDILGFGEAIYRQEPALWKRLKDKWDSEFTDTPVDVVVDMEINHIGTMVNPIKNEIEE